MANLIGQLSDKTQDLKNFYVLYAVRYAAGEYDRVGKFISDYHAGKIGDREKKDAAYFKAQKLVYGTYGTIVSRTKDEHISRAKKSAERHYADSITKLAERLTKKGVNEAEPFEVTYSRFNVNIEIVIKHGSKTTRAYTIIASGPIQKPHYRYIVK